MNNSSIGFFEIIYGILFDPVQTFRRLSANPPLLLTLLIVTLVNILVTAMSMLTLRTVSQAGPVPEVAELFASALPIFMVAGFFFWYARWLLFGAVLNLSAQLFGGKGSAAGSLVVLGLAALPALLLIPVEAVVVLLNLHSAPVSLLLALLRFAVFIWSLVLVIIGLREIHQLETGRAVLAMLAPIGFVFGLALVLIMVMAFGVAALLPAIPGI